MASKRKRSDDNSSSEEEFKVAHIVDTRTTGQVKARSTQFLVMWEGYPEPTWEPQEHVQDTCALGRYLELCKYREVKAIGKASACRAGRGASTEEEGAPKLSRREMPIARSKYCVARAGDAGLGVFALETIRAGTFLWMYAGKRMCTGNRSGGAVLRYIKKQGGDIHYCYLCQGGVTIDASQGGNDSRFVNHYEGE
jgi:hypothetical protein